MDNAMMDFMETKTEIIVLSADATKNAEIEGMSVFYTFNTDFKGVMNSVQSFGQKPGKIWMDFSRIQKIVTAPAKYIGYFGMKVGSDGKPILVLKDLDYISDVRLTPYEQPDPSLTDPNYPKYAPAPAKATPPAEKTGKSA